MNRSLTSSKNEKKDPDLCGAGALREGVIALKIRKNEIIKNKTVFKPKEEFFGWTNSVPYAFYSIFYDFPDFPERSDLLRC